MSHHPPPPSDSRPARDAARRGKPKYQPPRLIPLGDLAKGFGAGCAHGSGASGSCTNGSGANPGCSFGTGFV